MVELRKLCVSERQFCLDCGVILLPNEQRKHLAHNIKDSQLSNELLDTPTKLLLPLENKKTNAVSFRSHFP